MIGARGRPFEPGNHFGQGRPKGSRNKSKLVQGLLDQHAEPLVRSCIFRAIKGDPTALRLCMERMSPVRRDTLVRMPMPAIRSVAEVDQAGETVLQNIVRGKITPLEGKILSGILEDRRRVIETGDLSERIEKLEEDAAGKRAPRGQR